MGVEFLDEKQTPGVEFLDDEPKQTLKKVKRETLLDKAANNPVINAILGAGDAAAHGFSAGYLNPHTGTGTSYDIGRFAGSLLPYAVAEMATEGAATPVMARMGLAPKAAKIASRIGAGGLFGASVNPEHRLEGLTLGTAGGATGEALPYAIKGAGKALNIFRPKKLVQSLFDLVPRKLEHEKLISSDLYNNIFNRAGNSSIYGDLTRPSSIIDITTTGVPERTYPEVGSSNYLNFEKGKVRKFYNSGLKKLHDLFMENPTLNNAHSLQSQLGKELGDLNTMRSRLGALPAADRTLYDTYKGAREALKSDINQFLTKNHPDLAKQYSTANTHFLGNVIPNRNLSLVLNKIPKNATPKVIVNRLTKAINSDKEMPEYVYPLLENLQKRISVKNLAQKGAGAALGLALTHGMPTSAEVAGGLLGSVLGKPVSSALNLLPLRTGGKLLEKLYPTASKTALAGMLNL